MNNSLKTQRKRFYLATVDILQGVSIFLMVVGHAMLWWDPSLDTRWPGITPFGSVFIGIGLLAHPCFFFIYGFNVVNSLLRKEESERRETRHRLLKRTIIFFLVAEFCEGSAALVNSPKYLINFLLTWELFHMFALSTLVLLLVFEFAWQIDVKGYGNSKQVISVILLSLLLLIAMTFLLIHDYSNELGIQTFYVNLDINSILQRTVFEYGQNPVIPFLSFPIVGGLLASILDLPHEQKDIVLKKGKLVLTIGFIIFVIGIIFLGRERYVSTPMLYPASSSFVFIAIGVFLLITTIMILMIDLNSLYLPQTTRKVFLPVILISKISLTVYIVHNIAFIIPAKSQLVEILIPSETAIIVAGFLYSLFFVLISYYWQRWNFKYSLEWMILKLQDSQWRWWIKKTIL